MRTFAAIAFSVISLSAVAFQDNTPPDRVVQRVYVGPGDERVEGLGACSVTATDVSCWDMDGAKSTDLEDQLKAYLLTQSSDVSFKFRKKNRYLAIRKSGSSISLARAGGEYIQRQFSSGEDRPQFLGIAVEPNVTTSSLLISMQRMNVAPPVEFPFREGVHRVAGFEVTLGKAAPMDPRTMPNRYYVQATPNGDQFKFWNVPIQMSKRDPADPTMIYLSPLDSARRPIAYVDKKGEVISSVKYLESPRSNPNLSGYPVISKDYAQAVFQGGYSYTGTAMLHQTNINPSRIGYLRATVARSESVLIEGFPLDPR
jgi:hypothetical protein